MELELKQYLRIVQKRIWLIVAIVAISVVVTFVYTHYFIDPQYEASTKLIVTKSSEAQSINDKIDLGTINSNIQLIKTYKEIIKTPRIMDLVVKEYPDINKTADELIKEISVNAVNETQVMTLTVQQRSYEQAAAIVNAVSTIFQREISGLMKVDNVSILNEAKPGKNISPISPNVKLNIAISFVVSLMIGIGLAFLLEYLDDTVKNEQDVAALLDLPTFSVIPLIKSEDLQKQTGITTTNNVPGGVLNA
ncbi:YveK family protein [Paenibacillus agricola]|uniref:Lipopolysaccharide biosynthesis protein n=1 Tax=Paenibacillus agricola TaxID=2716264 RepID=A0ABX0JHD3_9BACL|nr:Wzz/FepE/Etk N-terminal domain-containing protein [Paenibacillus agricola]NHN34317.1 lipopolysaccharide biosynthesis protein [Paenibacillus agricola]